jgi:hypothetical protein
MINIYASGKIVSDCQDCKHELEGLKSINEMTLQFVIEKCNCSNSVVQINKNKKIIILSAF